MGITANRKKQTREEQNRALFFCAGQQVQRIKMLTALTISTGTEYIICKDRHEKMEHEFKRIDFEIQEAMEFLKKFAADLLIEDDILEAGLDMLRLEQTYLSLVKEDYEQMIQEIESDGKSE